MRVGILLSRIFWATNPYEGLDIRENLLNFCDVDIIAFEDDIRLAKEWRGDEKYHFDREKFNVSNLRIVRNWDQLYRISGDYSMIISPISISNKNDLPDLSKFKCRLGFWDIGGCDILPYHNGFMKNQTLFVKGKQWKDWLVKMGASPNNIYVTGSPHFDGYRNGEYKNIWGKPVIFITTSNPGTRSHLVQMDQNIPHLEKLLEKFGDDFEFWFESYPHDYLYYDGDYGSVYLRKDSTGKPHYESFIQKYPQLKLIKPNEHHVHFMSADRHFNMAGSHLAWETIFSGLTQSFSLNYSDKGYYKGNKSYLPEYVEFPCDVFNIELDEIDDDFWHRTKKRTLPIEMSDFIDTGNASSNIAHAIRRILHDRW